MRLARGLPVAGVGHRARRWSRSADAGVPADDPALVRAARLAARRAGRRVAGDWAVRRPHLRPAAGRSSSRTTTTPTSTTPPRSCSRCAASGHPGPERVDGGGRRAASTGCSGCSARRRLGRVRRRQHPRALPRAPVLRLRRGDRPAERRRHRARGRDARPPSGRPAARPRRGGHRVAARATRSRTAPGSGAGASTTSTAPAPPCRRWSPPASAPRDAARSGGRSRWLEDHQNADGGWGEDCAPTTTRPGSGAARAPPRRPRGRCSRCTPPASAVGRRRARRPLAGRRPSAPTARWDEPQFTGTGFPGDFYINYHLYRLVFPSWPSAAAWDVANRDEHQRPISPAAPRAPSAAAVMAHARHENFPVASRLLSAPGALAPARGLRLRAAGRRRRRRGAPATGWRCSTSSRPTSSASTTAARPSIR